MRKTLTALLFACIIAAGLTGCDFLNAPPTDAQANAEKLETLIAQLEAMHDPVTGNTEAHTQGAMATINTGDTTVVVRLPGGGDAAYVDHAVSLLPLAEEVRDAPGGTEMQRAAANFIIATIHADEASVMIRNAGNNFQVRISGIIAMRDDLMELQQSSAMIGELEGNRGEIITALQSGEIQIDDDFIAFLESLDDEAYPNAGAVADQLDDIDAFDGQQDLASQLESVDEAARSAREQVEAIRGQIDEQQTLMARYEADAAQLDAEALVSEGEVYFDKLEQAILIRRDAELARAMAEVHLQNQLLDALLAAYSAEADRLRLGGYQLIGGDSDLVQQIDAFFVEIAAPERRLGLIELNDLYAGYLAELYELQDSAQQTSAMDAIAALLPIAGNEAGLGPQTREYSEVSGMIAAVNAQEMSDMQRAAAFCSQLRTFGNNITPDELDDGPIGGVGSDIDPNRTRLANILFGHIFDHLGLIGAVELTVTQLNLELAEVGNVINQLESDRDTELARLTDLFNQLDDEIASAGFDQMAAVAERLENAEEALLESGFASQNTMHHMSIHVLAARSLSQQLLAATEYHTTLESIAAIGSDVLGDDLLAEIVDRIEEMDALIESTIAAANAMHNDSDVSGLARSVYDQADTSNREGRFAAEQIYTYSENLMVLGVDTNLWPDTSAPEPQAPEPDADDSDNSDDNDGGGGINLSGPDDDEEEENGSDDNGGGINLTPR